MKIIDIDLIVKKEQLSSCSDEFIINYSLKFTCTNNNGASIDIIVPSKYRNIEKMVLKKAEEKLLKLFPK